MATYDEMVDNVLAWSNRDTEVISYRNIKNFINFGIDNAYRKLRIAPMETIRTYTIGTIDQGDHALTIPSDLIEPIQLRRQNMDTNDKRFPSLGYDVYSAKADVRSFYDEYLNQYGQYFYTRERNTFLLSPAFEEGEVYELYYYRRFAEADARYNVDTDTDTDTSTYWYATTRGELTDTADDSGSLVARVKFNESSTVFQTDPDLFDLIEEDSNGNFRLGKLVPHWLRDENEKVMLFGAVMQAAIFLNDAELLNMYSDRFVGEIESLNMEDNRRQLRGGNIQQRFQGNGLI